MTVTCSVCGALHWLCEWVKTTSASSPKFSHCCHGGKVLLPSLPAPPDFLRSLFTENTSVSREFRERVRQYNSALAFTSFIAKDTNDNSGGGGPWVWKTGYTIYHQIGTFLPLAGKSPKYSQLYFYDPDEALRFRMQRNQRLNEDTMFKLQNMLRNVHCDCPLFMHSLKVLQTTPSRDLGIRIVADSSTDARHYNAPTVDEVAVLFPGDASRARHRSS